MTPPRTFQIGNPPDDLQRVRDSEGATWERRNPDRWVETEYNERATWHRLVSEYGPLTEVPTATVTNCAWCPDWSHPDTAHHPNGQVEHNAEPVTA